MKFQFSNYGLKEDELRVAGNGGGDVDDRVTRKTNKN